MHKQNSPRIPEETWRRYEEIIFLLYVIQNKALTAPGGVKDIMTIKYNFTATKAQYETRLKKWGFQKYRSANNRRATLSNISQGIPKNSATARQPSMYGESGQAEAFTFPRNIPFRTPSPNRQKLQVDRPDVPSLVISSVSTAVNTGPRLTSGLDLGLMSIQQKGRTSVNDPHTSDPINSMWHGFHEGDAIASTHSSSILVHSQSTTSDVFPAEMFADDVHGWKCIGSTSTSDYLTGYPLVETILSGNPFIIDFADVLMPIASRITHMAKHSAHAVLSMDRTFLQSAVGSNLDLRSSSRASQLVRQHSINYQIIYATFHRLMNDNKIGYALKRPQTQNDYLFQASIGYIFSLGGQFLVSMIDVFPEIYRAALTQGLFVAALVIGNGPVLEAILDRADLANQPLRISEYLSEYPLGYAVGMRDLSFIQILLRCGADPNKITFYPTTSDSLYSIEDHNEDHDMQILALLLDHDLRIGSQDPTAILTYWTKNEFVLLVTRDLDQAFQVFLKHGLLPSLLRRSDWDESLFRIFRSFLERGKLDGTIPPDVWGSILTDCLCLATLLKNGSEAHLLLEMGAVPDGNCLVSSVLSDNLLLLERFVDMGADANALSTSRLPHPSDRPHIFTALSKSIVHESQRAFQLFEERGFILELSKNVRALGPALLAACEIGNAALVGTLLTKPKFLYPGDLVRALENSISKGHKPIYNLLLAAKILPTVSCLEAAYRTKQTALINTLLDFVCPTPRIFCGAMRNGDRGILEEMLRNGLPVNDIYLLDDDNNEGFRVFFGIFTSWNTTLLTDAVLQQSEVAVEVLLAHGAHVNPQYPRRSTIAILLTPLAACVVRQDVPLLTELLYRGADPFDNVAIYLATVYGSEDITGLILLTFKHRYPHGARNFGSNALCWAIGAGSQPLVKMLIKEVDISGVVEPWAPCSKKTKPRIPRSPIPRSLLQSPEIIPVREGYKSLPAPPLPRLPLPRPTHPRYDDVPLLLTSPLGEAIRTYCCQNATLQFLHVLLPHIRDLDAVVVKHKMHGRLTGILYAISLGSLDTVRLLVEAGADIHLAARRQVNRTALQFATERGNKEILEYLLMKGVSPNEPPAANFGATSLQLAAIKGYVGLASILVDAKAQVNAEPALLDGRTAFEGATEHGRIEMMIFLVQHGADLLSNNRRQHRRAVEFARENEQHVAVQLADELLKKVLESQGSGGPGEDEDRESPVRSEFGADRSVWSVSEFLNDAEFDVGF